MKGSLLNPAAVCRRRLRTSAEMTASRRGHSYLPEDFAQLFHLQAPFAPSRAPGFNANAAPFVPQGFTAGVAPPAVQALAQPAAARAVLVTLGLVGS